MLPLIALALLNGVLSLRHSSAGCACHAVSRAALLSPVRLPSSDLHACAAPALDGAVCSQPGHARAKSVMCAARSSRGGG